VALDAILVTPDRRLAATTQRAPAVVWFYTPRDGVPTAG
jgi:hypothetical protein